MARIKWWTYLLNEEGQIITGADIGIYLAGTSTPAKIYKNETSDQTFNSTWQLQTNQDGYCEFWIGDASDDNGYPSTQKFKIAWNKTGISSGYNDYISILPVTIPVDLYEVNSIKDKSVSNNLAIGWENHKNNNTYFVHGLQAVDKTSTNTTFNKLVSNSTAKEWEDTKWVSWSYITNDQTALANRAYFLDSSSNTVTLELPANPIIGDPVAVSIIDVSNTIEIGGNGKNIFGSASNLPITVDKIGFTLVYSGDTYGWAIVNQIIGISSLDGDTIQIDFSPTYYTRDFSIAEASSVLDLSAHLKGIDNEINTINTNINGVESSLSAHIDDFDIFSTLMENHINNTGIHTANDDVSTTYIHTQPSPAITWTITHNLDSQDLVFDVYDGTYKRIVPETAQLTDLNTLVLTFSSAVAGKCIIGGATIQTEPYDPVLWNKNNAVPTKNAIRDKIEDMVNDTEFLSAAIYENISDIEYLTLVTTEMDGYLSSLSASVADLTVEIDELSASSATPIDLTLSGLSTNQSYESSGIIRGVVGESVSFKDVLYRNPSDNKWYKSDNSDYTRMPTSTIAIESKLADEICKMIDSGYIRDDSWSFPLTGEKIIYTGKLGDIVYNTDELSAGYSQPIGCIFSSNIIKFSPSFLLVDII